jgi:hypothetical protein
MMRSVAFVVVMLLALAVLAHTDTIHVPADQPTIQAGIYAAVDGDTVLVAPGTYVENIDFLGKAITVMSEQGAEVTIIDGGQAGSVVSFQNGEGPDSVLEGFTITNGTGNLFHSPYSLGGGICCFASPMIKKNVITHNSAIYGGGVFCNNGIIKENTIKENIAGYHGGGISTTGDSSTIAYNTIVSNDSLWDGGGIFCGNYSKAQVFNNIISGNGCEGVFC